MNGVFPASWSAYPLSLLGESFGGIAFRPEDLSSTPAPDRVACYRTSNIQRELTDLDLFFIPRELVRNQRQFLRVGDILISTANSEPLVGKCVLVSRLLHESTLGGFISGYRPNNSLVDSQFLHFWLSSPLIQARLRAVSRRTTNIANLAMSDVLRVLIPLPPLSEQQRIVEILQQAEEIRHLRARAEVKTAKLIPAVFEGIFGDPIGNPKRWPIHDLADLIESTPKNGLYKPANRYGEGTPIIRIGDFGNGYTLDVRDLQRVRLSDGEIEQFGVSNDQILINRVNSIEHLGKSVLVTGVSEPTVYESNMMRLTLRRTRVEPDFLIACLQHSSVLSKLRGKAKKAINQASINQTDVMTLRLAVPPIKLQQTFAKRVADIHAIEVADSESRRLGSVLSASVSAHVFSGQLTADWRGKRRAKLATEVRKRDEELAILSGKPVKVDFSTADPAAEAEAFKVPDNLNREQKGLLIHTKIRHLKKATERKKTTVSYFTAELLAAELDGPLRRNPQAIEAHLSVFAARGLIIPVSREEQTEDTGEYVFGNAYRLPRRDRDDVLADEKGEGITTESGEAISTGQILGDHSRLREMERLVARLEKERTLT